MKELLFILVVVAIGLRYMPNHLTRFSTRFVRSQTQITPRSWGWIRISKICSSCNGRSTLRRVKIQELDLETQRVFETRGVECAACRLVLEELDGGH